MSSESKLKTEIGNLSYSIEQLCSDVETSLAGISGSHRKAIERVRRNVRSLAALMDANEVRVIPKWDGKTHTGSCGSPYGSSCPCGN